VISLFNLVPYIIILSLTSHFLSLSNTIIMPFLARSDTYCLTQLLLCFIGFILHTDFTRNIQMIFVDSSISKLKPLAYFYKHSIVFS